MHTQAIIRLFSTGLKEENEDEKIADRMSGRRIEQCLAGCNLYSLSIYCRVSINQSSPAFTTSGKLFIIERNYFTIHCIASKYLLSYISFAKLVEKDATFDMLFSHRFSPE